MHSIQAGYISYQLHSQGPIAQLRMEEECYFDKLYPPLILIVMKQLNDEDRIRFIMTCKKVYNVYQEEVRINPAFDHRPLLKGIRKRNITYTAVKQFKNLNCNQIYWVPACLCTSTLAFTLIVSSSGCCCCTMSATASLGMKYASGACCSLSIVQSCVAYCYNVHYLNKDRENSLIKANNDAEEELRLIKIKREIESQPRCIAMIEPADQEAPAEVFQGQ